MAAMSDYLENKLIDFIFRGGSFTPPTTMYVALMTSIPIDAGGGSEVTGGSYARQSIVCNTTNFAATQAAGSTAATSSGTSGTTSNNVAISFAGMPACTVVATAIYDASTGGNLLWWGSLTASKAFSAGDTANFFAGQLSVQIDN